MNHAKTQTKAEGFTLIELLLAMAFISMLLLAIALTVLQISQVYNRGLTLKEVDQASRNISTGITHDISSAAAFSLNNGAQRYVTQTWGGALCLGQYSYVWNFGKAVDTYNKGGNNSLNVLIDTAGKKTAFNIVKVIDTGGGFCVDATQKTITKANAVELLQTTDHNLAVHQFCVNSQATAADALTGQQLYTVAYSLGTNDVNALTAGTQDACTGVNQSDGLTACKNPSQSGADLQYCTVQEFSIVVRAQNALN